MSANLFVVNEWTGLRGFTVDELLPEERMAAYDHVGLKCAECQQRVGIVGWTVFPDILEFFDENRDTSYHLSCYRIIGEDDAIVVEITDRKNVAQQRAEAGNRLIRQMEEQRS